MASGFRVGSTDLDDVFDPYVQGTKPAVTGYKVGSQDLRDRYAPIVYGVQAPATSFKIANGADLNTLFAKKGTAIYEHVVSDPGYPNLSHSYSPQNPSGTVTAFTQLSLVRGGTWSKAEGDTGSPGPSTNGDWFDPPRADAGDDYQVKFTFTVSRDDGATITNDAANWTALSATRTFGAHMSAAQFNTQDKIVTGTLRIQIRRASNGEVLSDVSVPVNVKLFYA